MKYPRTLTALVVLLSLYSGGVTAKNLHVIVPGGDVHLRGQLTNGACSVSADSQDLHVDMGQYTTHTFLRPGDVTAPGIPFTIRLTDCSPDLADGVGITFTGVTAPKAPDAFRVSVSDTRPTGVSGGDGFSGLGLLISDADGNPVIPGRAPDVLHHPDGGDTVLHYLARYRSTSRGVYPGDLHSDVRFDIAYP
ncbi:fimbrial protein [Enterobacter cancerogenus]|uniref:fimbrial protein n=1 Tax=Enterobacter cancerogenus TaxID=69218 RepID=UPI004059BD43